MLKKLKSMVRKHKKALIGLATVACLIMSMGAIAFADETPQSVAASLDFTPITSALSDAVTPGDIINVIAKVIVIGIPFVIAWFGFRFLWAKFRGAVTRGKM